MATLLSAVVHLDRIQPFRDQRKLLWYKVETMRLANETLSNPLEGSSDQMILVALILLYFNVSHLIMMQTFKINAILRLEAGIQMNMRSTLKESIRCLSLEAV
jgi:hypothetical protein